MYTNIPNSVHARCWFGGAALAGPQRLDSQRNWRAHMQEPAQGAVQAGLLLTARASCPVHNRGSLPERNARHCLPQGYY